MTAASQITAISKIKPNADNSRTHSSKQIRQIANSILAFGFTNPLLISEDGELIAGHGRYEAAKLVGLLEVPVIVVRGLSPGKRRALGIADNKIAQNSKWDRKRLAIEIPELAGSLTADGLDVSILGFEAVEIDHIIQTDFENHVVDPQDRIDPKWCAAPTVSKPGDLWVLGNHKLLCGDACSAGDIARLMTDCRADMAFFSPVANEKIPDFCGLFSTALDAAASMSREGAVHFACIDWQHFAELVAAAKPVYGKPIDVVVWMKSKADQGVFYRSQHEFIGVFGVGKEPHHHIEQGRHKRLRSNVWHYAEVNSFGAATTKPVALIADAIKDCTRKGDIVLDTFSGLGTTIMAAERLGRHARALELEPRFVDHAIRRWQASTQREAQHSESGLSFDQIAADSALSALIR
jgi:DNA modification methylase